jgi:2-oxoglutarate ferredoxin oxidoreductase subunit alpha
MADWGRYKDADGDAIPWRTLPGTHPTKGSFFTRGSSHDEYARYTENGEIHARVIDRLLKKFATAATLVPAPEIRIADKESRTGIIYFGSTWPAVEEALAGLAADGLPVNAMRLRAFPFNDEVKAFCDAHDRIFVVEQNRDAQMRSLLMIEAGIPGDKLVATLNYDGFPLTAQFVRGAIEKAAAPLRAAAE